MQVLLLLVLPVALAASPNSRIVGGSDQDIANFQFQGSYRIGPAHSCGCVFLGADWVLTAGHCGGGSAYTMEFGGTNRGEGTVFSVESVLRHPDYDVGPGFTPNDIALVRSTQMISGPNIAAGTLAASADNPGGTGFITGWGRTCGTCELPTTLQGTEINIISDAECSGIYNTDFQAESMICVWGGSGAGIGSCNGDSGGPMSVGNTIYGVTSWGIIFCNTEFPSVYARVGAYKPWVCDNTRDEASGC